MNNPLADPYQVLYKVYIGGKYLKQSLSETDTDPTTRGRTVKICYGVLERDEWLSAVIAANTKKPPRGGVRLILKIAIYMRECLSRHDYMVTNEAVELCKKAGKGGAASFVNAFLRSYKVPEAPSDPVKKLSFEAGVPEWIARRFLESYGEEAKDILCAKSLGLCVRFERGAEDYLDKEHIDTPFAGAYIFPNFVRDSGFFSGDYTFQSPGSIAICDMVTPCRSLLDACAAPGGKSVLLSKKCESVTAQDIYPHRVRLIEEYAARMNAANVTAVEGDSSLFNPAYEGAFSAVLCDVPCSGLGVLNENPDIRIFRKEADISSICAVQRAILSNCSKYVESGGALCFSTCSVLPCEGDEIVEDFLKSHPDFSVEKKDSPLSHRETRCGLQFLPHISMGAGFYFCAMRRS